MKYLKIIIYCFLITQAHLSGQGLTLPNGATFIAGSAVITIHGNWTNAGTFTPGTSTVIFNNASGNQTITNSNGESFFNLAVNKAADNVQLLNNITVTGTLTITRGDLDINGNSISLGTGASLSETKGCTGCNGTITTTENLNSPSSLNVCGLGIEITTNADLGSTTITRGSTPQSSGGNTGIKRYYDITPTTTTTGLNADLVFHYDDTELNGATESALQLYKSNDNGATWSLVGGVVNTESNEVSISGVDSFSRWTLSGTALPVELTIFEARLISTTVQLNWETATEVNNYGFEIERQNSEDSSQNSKPALSGGEVWETLGFVQGNGNSNSPKNYSFIDFNLPDEESVSYRLKQIDNDGTFAYSKTIEIDLATITGVEEEEIPTVYSLSQNYPNPFNPTTTIKFGIPEQGTVDLRVYNILGEEVASLISKEMTAGYHEVEFGKDNLTSGMYIYRINVDGKFSSVKKMILLK